VAAYFVRRLLLSVFVLWGTVTLVFVVMRIVPGDPALMILGPDAQLAELDALRRQMGLDDPLIVQYANYLWGALRLDFGESIRLGGDAMDQVLGRMPVTLLLAGAALLVAVVVGVSMGILAALNFDTRIDRTVTTLSLVTHSAPSFWVGLVLILICARQLQVLPSGGAGSLAHLVLPALAAGLPFSATLTRFTRSGLLEVINEGYIQTARSKGLSERVVIIAHAIRNSLIPIVTVVGLYAGGILGGTVVIETVFSWPGMGRLIVDSIGYRDYAVVQAGIVLITFVFVAINLLVDVLYGYLDPRVRLGGKS
jgi:ABC-type dipeptide/oligopeptide/nickel transport system permease component